MSDFKDKQKEKLSAELARIEKELADFSVKTGEGYKPATSDYGDSADDTARETEEYEKNLATDSALLELKNKIEAALKRTEDGTYGWCEVEGAKHEIERERLEAFPAAATCLKHAE